MRFADFGRHGRSAYALKFANVTNYQDNGSIPSATEGQTVLLYLHGSGTNPITAGEYWSATMLQDLAYSTSDEMYWSVRSNSLSGASYIQCNPRDRHPDNNDGSVNLNSYHMGYTHDSVGLDLIQHRRYDQLLEWLFTQYPQCSRTKVNISGDSVGAWSTMLFGLRRPTKFAALYPNRPRVRWASTPGGLGGTGWIQVPDWVAAGGSILYDTGSVSGPSLSSTDGGGLAKDFLDSIAYVSNTANAIPWIGWVIGKNDGYMPWQDQVDFIAALRTAGRGFAVSWNLGDHGGAPNIQDITTTYPYGTFEIGKGYPIFSNHSLDGDPAVDDVGGINLGLKFRNVVESASGWSCEVTHNTSACTVDVKPKSSVFTASVAAQTANITSANSWVSVSFSA